MTQPAHNAPATEDRAILTKGQLARKYAAILAFAFAGQIAYIAYIVTGGYFNALALASIIAILILLSLGAWAWPTKLSPARIIGTAIAANIGLALVLILFSGSLIFLSESGILGQTFLNPINAQMGAIAIVIAIMWVNVMRAP